MNWINRRFTIDGMVFDCAIDIAHELHAYNRIPKGTIPVELYNCSKDWDIHMVYPKAKDYGDITDDYLIEQIREWSKPENHEEYYEDEEYEPQDDSVWDDYDCEDCYSQEEDAFWE